MKQFIILYFCSLCICSSQASLVKNDILNPKIKWRFKTQGAIRGTPLISDNTIYFGSSDGFIYALNKQEGNLIWKYKTNGAIVSAPIILGSSLFISSRDNYLYALNIKNGSLNWKFKMQKNITDNHGGWKYFMASPMVVGDQVLIGSGDSHLYALNITNGKMNWKFKTNGRIRSTPLVYKKEIYQPSNDGYVYVLNLKGELSWKFETIGANYNPDDYSFDRSSIIAQPLIENNILIIASRDGNTYGIDLGTHEKKWNFTYGTTWAMSTNISNNMVFVGWSTNNLFCALDLETGEKKWQFKTGAHNFPKALLSKNSIYIGSANGSLYKLNKFTGEKQWEYSVGGEIFSSPIYDANTIYFGCDDGNLYALEEGVRAHKAVFSPVNNKGELNSPKASKKLVSYLTNKGFEYLNSEKSLFQFINNRMLDKTPSTIVFNYLVIPKSIIGENPEKGLMRQYLEAGGKVIWMGDIPNFYEQDSSGKVTFSKVKASKLLDVEFDVPESGNYFSTTTQEGQNMGLPLWLKTNSVSVSSKDIIPLAYNEFNDVSIWMKKFHPSISSGYISCRTWSFNVPAKTEDLNLIYQLAVYGLE